MTSFNRPPIILRRRALVSDPQQADDFAWYAFMLGSESGDWHVLASAHDRDVAIDRIKLHEPSRAHRNLVALARHEAYVAALLHATAERMAREHESIEVALSITGRDVPDGEQIFSDAYMRLVALWRMAQGGSQS